jgi:O-antigen/teichoic acid export membrane protein
MTLNPTLRNLGLVVLAAAVVTALGLDDVLASLVIVVQIAFVVAIAYVLFTLWRQRREEIGTWPLRARSVFYGAVVLAIANVGLAFAFAYPSTGLEAVVFFVVLVACVFAMWRVWRDEHTYGY